MARVLGYAGYASENPLVTFTLTANSLLTLQAAPAVTQEAEAKTDPNIEFVDKKPVKDRKITDRSHPDYVRCKSAAVIGSRARRKRTCMSNREWELAPRVVVTKRATTWSARTATAL
jgi:hypothetical protein